jgi:alkylresorcinol/alkylpyrone synthase
MEPKILTVATQPAPHSYQTEEIIALLPLWLGEESGEVQRMAERLFRRAGIASRQSILPLEQLFSDMSFEEKNDHYRAAATDLAEAALRKALAQAELTPRDIDIVITTSCTGFMIPSVDAHLINRLGMRQDVMRLPVTEMGCAGGTSGLIYADQFLRANADKRIALVAVEAPAITLQKRDLSMENLVSAAIFGDGAAAAILAPTARLAPRILDTQMYHFPQAAHLMGFELRNSGLKIVLDKDVPANIAEHFNRIVLPFLEKNLVSLAEVDNFLFHPGGKKIVQQTEALLARYGKDIAASKEVLRRHGNMSSATVLFILAKYLEREIAPKELGLMLAFGPGFTAQTLLLEWN